MTHVGYLSERDLQLGEMGARVLLEYLEDESEAIDDADALAVAEQRATHGLHLAARQPVDDHEEDVDVERGEAFGEHLLVAGADADVGGEAALGADDERVDDAPIGQRVHERDRLGQLQLGPGALAGLALELHAQLEHEDALLGTSRRHALLLIFLLLLLLSVLLEGLVEQTPVGLIIVVVVIAVVVSASLD